METEVKVLDHGYLRHIQTWGSDDSIISSARMSTDKGFKGWDIGTKCKKCGGTGEIPPNASTVSAVGRRCDDCDGRGEHGDEKLLRYLWEHKHATPFEMAGLVLEVQAPIFVFREWQRHRSVFFSYNEFSARYTELPDTFYVPSMERIRLSKQSKTNKQGSEAVGLSDGQVNIIRGAIESANRRAREQYEALLVMGVAREVARVVVPVGQYSRMRVQASLRNWLAFLTLRLDPSAQWEIREYALRVGDVIANQFPRTWELFMDTKR